MVAQARIASLELRRMRRELIDTQDPGEIHRVKTDRLLLLAGTYFKNRGSNMTNKVTCFLSRPSFFFSKGGGNSFFFNAYRDRYLVSKIVKATKTKWKSS